MALDVQSRAEPDERYRKSACLVTYWQGADIIIHNYATNVATRVSRDDLLLVSRIETWTAFADAHGSFPEESLTAFRDRLERLVASTIVRSSRDATPAAERAFQSWGGWLPTAAFFHQATKDYTPRKAGSPGISLRLSAPEEPLKRSPGGESRRLPAFPKSGQFPELLLGRRTWRRFGSEPVTLKQVSTLLGLTWAVQAWAEGVGERIALKTSPSGGGRHSIEVYLLANDVAGLDPGLFHYDPDNHAVSKIDAQYGTELTAALLPDERSSFRAANALFFMTSVFPRVQWRYQSARAYRVILLEAGHLAQTFCLVAQWLGLAPFCTGALNDSRIEDLLGIDGVNESVLYATGVGARPKGRSWAPWPNSEKVPRTHEPKHARRSDDV